MWECGKMTTHNQAGVTKAVLNIKKSNARYQTAELKFLIGSHTSQFSTFQVNIHVSQIFGEALT
jgi:hypothetical protein